MIECIKAISQGFSHKAQNKTCQDFAIAIIDKNKIYSILAVADGHGGEKYFRSERGAELAVKIAKVQAINFVKAILEISASDRKKELVEENAKLLESRIVFKWQEYVKHDFEDNPLNDAEKNLCERLKLKFGTPEESEIDIFSLYGTTLLVSIYIPNIPFYLSIQIGDGLTFALDGNNDDFYPIPEDENLGFGYTTSLCSFNAIGKFRHSFEFKKLNALVLCSDGVADSFAKGKFGDFVRKIRGNIIEHEKNAVQKDLEDFFPKLSEQGAGDDVSFAGVFETEEEDEK